MNKPKTLITQSLISSWLWSYKLDKGYENFLKTLNRERTPPTKAMLDGQQLENIVNAVTKGAEIKLTHKWYKPVMEIAKIVTGAQQQVALSRVLTVDGITFVCYGVLDYLKAGVIYDCKFSKTYKVNKYLDSPQWPMYFYLVPEAHKFQFLICDGAQVYKEIYYPNQAEPIERTIKNFLDFLERMKLSEIYFEKWVSKY